jgi:fumarate reductase flavoprotein subunit
VKDAVKKQEERIDRIIKGADGKENVYEVRNAMQDQLMDYVGIFRNGEDLKKAVDNLQVIYERSQKVGLRSYSLGANPELALALKIRGMVRMALCVAYAALQRTESGELMPAKTIRNATTATG